MCSVTSKDVGAMDEVVMQSLSKYYSVLEKTGHVKYLDSQKLLVLSFLWSMVYSDFNAYLTKEDYHTIERALDCLYGTTCLITYPDYLKMGKLYLGRMTELAQRVKTVENNPVLKLVHDLDSVDNKDAESDVIVMAEDGGNN